MKARWGIFSKDEMAKEYAIVTGFQLRGLLPSHCATIAPAVACFLESLVHNSIAASVLSTIHWLIGFLLPLFLGGFKSSSAAIQKKLPRLNAFDLINRDTCLAAMLRLTSIHELCLSGTSIYPRFPHIFSRGLTNEGDRYRQNVKPDSRIPVWQGRQYPAHNICKTCQGESAMTTGEETHYFELAPAWTYSPPLYMHCGRPHGP